MPATPVRARSDVATSADSRGAATLPRANRFGDAARDLFERIAAPESEPAALLPAGSLPHGRARAQIPRGRPARDNARPFGRKAMRGLLQALRSAVGERSAGAPATQAAGERRRRAADVQSGEARAAVLGVNDGLVTNTSLILGVAGATGAPDVVQLAGLASLVAGAGSMAIGEWVSMRAQVELLERLLRGTRGDRGRSRTRARDPAERDAARRVRRGRLRARHGGAVPRSRAGAAGVRAKRPRREPGRARLAVAVRHLLARRVLSRGRRAARALVLRGR